MRSLLRKILFAYPPMYLFVQIFRNRVGAVRGTLESVHDKFAFADNSGTRAVDLGCGSAPKNLFRAETCFGIDLYEDESLNVAKARLGFEPLPFPDEHFDYVTAYDLLEHIPRYADLPTQGNTPFIYLMNEIYRIMKNGGVFLSMTPIYPYLGAFQDPTHNNIMTIDTLPLYFSNEKLEIAKHYGVATDFEIMYQKMLGQHLIAVLKK